MDGYKHTATQDDTHSYSWNLSYNKNSVRRVDGFKRGTKSAFKSLLPVRLGNGGRGVLCGTDPGVLVEALEDVPAPVAVLAVLSEAVQVKQALHSLRTQEVVSVSRLGGTEPD